MTTEDSSNDPEALRGLLVALLDLFADVVHGRDRAMQVIQAVPNWMERYQEALDNPLRQQHSEELIDATRVLFSIGLGPLSSEQLHAVRLKLNKKPD